MSKNKSASILGLALFVLAGYWAYSTGAIAKLLTAITPKKSTNNPVATPAAKKANTANQALSDALISSRNPVLPSLALQWTAEDEARSRAADADPDRPLIVRATSSVDDGGSWSRTDGNYES